MNAEVRQYLDAAVYRMTLPIARFLLRFGMTANEFGNLCRSAFVRAAAEEFERAGKKPNQSRIAVRTGLHRREVKTYLENDWKEVRNHEWHRHRTTRVPSGWGAATEPMATDSTSGVGWTGASSKAMRLGR